MMFKKAIRSIAIVLCFSIVNVWFFIEPVIFIASVLFCISLSVAWPMKFVYMALSFLVVIVISKVINKLDVWCKSHIPHD